MLSSGTQWIEKDHYYCSNRPLVGCRIPIRTGINPNFTRNAWLWQYGTTLTSIKRQKIQNVRTVEARRSSLPLSHSLSLSARIWIAKRWGFQNQRSGKSESRIVFRVPLSNSTIPEHPILNSLPPFLLLLILFSKIQNPHKNLRNFADFFRLSLLQPEPPPWPLPVTTLPAHHRLLLLLLLVSTSLISLTACNFR